MYKVPRVQLLAQVTLSLFVLFVALRAVFYWGFSEVGTTVTTTDATFWRTISIGLRFDLRLAALMVLPLFVLAFFPRWNLSNTKILRQLGLAYMILALAIALLIYIFDFGHYAYLGIRMNSSVVRFFDDMQISYQMVMESYPVAWITFGWFGVLVFMGLLWKRWFGFLGQSKAKGELPRWKAFALGFVVFASVFFTSFGKYSLTPLRWSDAFFSGNTAVASLGLNPVLYLSDSFHLLEHSYSDEVVQEYYPYVARYLGLPEQMRSEDTYSRERAVSDHAVVAEGKRKPNIVVVMLESLGASRLGVYGNPLAPSPNLDMAAENGYLFEHFYVPVSGTARTVFAGVTGLPDVSTVKTATRNPMITDQNTVINAFTGFEKFYFLGGSAAWANMNSLIKTSIEGVTLYQEGDYSAPIVDVWGISDHSLFQEADAILRKQAADKPFFAIIQTAANHRPFTIPEENTGFETITVSDEDLNKWGYKNLAQFNAVRLLDHNIGKFFEMAKASGYFEDTIFVFYGDHNNRISHLGHMKPFYQDLDVAELHVPGIIYSPKYLQPKRFDEAMSLLDVMPTLAGMVGVPYVNSSMGRDYFEPRTDEDRLVYTQRSAQNNPVIGLISKQFMVRMHHDLSDVKLHDLSLDTPSTDVSALYPEKKEMMMRTAKGIYETSKYLHYYNSAKWRKANK
jgi:phosphoglycerol transferase MdoB-like AlkP superfamily enzyme